MRHLTFALASLMLVLPSCAVTKKLEAMNEQEFAVALQDIELTASISFSIAKSEIRPEAQKTLLSLSDFILHEEDAQRAAGVTNSLTELIEFLEPQMLKNGLNEKEVGLVKASMLMLDRYLGLNKLGLDSVIGAERTKQVVMAVFRGLEVGLK